MKVVIPQLVISAAIVTLLLYCEGTDANLLRQFMPTSWRNVCHRVAETTVTRAPIFKLPSWLEAILQGSSGNDDSDPGHTNVTLVCVVPNDKNFHWKLNDLRDWVIKKKFNDGTTPDNREVNFVVNVACVPGANISLPWPMKVPGMKELHVRHCRLTDRYVNHGDPVESSLPDELQVLDVRHSSWVIGMESTDFSLTTEKALNLTSDYECGQDTTLELLIFRNVSDVPGDLGNMTLPSMAPTADLPEDDGQGGPARPEDRLIQDTETLVSDTQQSGPDTLAPLLPPSSMDLGNGESKDAQIDFLDLLKKSFHTRTICHFTNLRLLDESMAQFTPLFHFEFLVQGAEYPSLEVMNYSRIGMRDLPRELAEWRRYFPKLRLLDLSHNHISSMAVKNFPSIADTGVTTFDLQFNNITTVDLEMFTEWGKVNDFVVDIRNNPIHCGCDMKLFIPTLQKPFVGDLAKYNYVRTMPCVTPSSLAGRQLRELDVESLPCMKYGAASREALLALGITVFILVFMLLALLRYKFEIRVLLYTRLHIRLPCDSDAPRNNKTYDAFVSYSNDDGPWVYDNLVRFLEGEESKTPSSSTTSSPTSPFPGSPTFMISNGFSSQSSRYGQKYHNGGYSMEEKFPPPSPSSPSPSNRNNKTGPPFRLCLHERNFVPGKAIVDNIVDSIEASRHTIIVLSPRFMKSHWAMEELRQAYKQSLLEKTRHLIVLLLETIPKEDMDPLISRCCKTFTYLSVNDSLFKDRLIFSLTTKDRASRRRDRLAEKEERRQTKHASSHPGWDNPTFNGTVQIPRPPKPSRGLSTSPTTVLADYL